MLPATPTRIAGKMISEVSDGQAKVHARVQVSRGFGFLGSGLGYAPHAGNALVWMSSVSGASNASGPVTTEDPSESATLSADCSEMTVVGVQQASLPAQ